MAKFPISADPRGDSQRSGRGGDRILAPRGPAKYEMTINIAQKLPEKKIPSTQAKARRRSAKDAEPSIQRRAHSAFFLTQGTVSTLDGVEEAVLLGGVLDVGLQEEAIHLGVDVLDGDLKAIEGARLGDLDLLHEPPGEVLEDDAVEGGEEGEDVGDEVLLVRGQGLALAEVLGEVHLLVQSCR
ncbi:hypothetical protein Tsubulata_029901 [Turnera subulata]|uniref:Uncharacterized protein n=1 Tax=Turnera subulata TaxID=218843 RepID=A0A9Q0FWT3_9ROSI|nr:hypothetical protein Tsubulata_029901 [Turnera subulata]